MTKPRPKKGTRVFDLEERTARFGEAVLAFARTLRADAVTRPLISQLVRAGTSVGANYLENGARRFLVFVVWCLQFAGGHAPYDVQS